VDIHHFMLYLADVLKLIFSFHFAQILSHFFIEKLQAHSHFLEKPFIQFENIHFLFLSLLCCRYGTGISSLSRER
tara:strand:- start:148224 stop:148448 length:225 start_codon:yes stop_codon:yes gene_type:complete